LKVPMVAMSDLLWCLEPAPIAASMAIEGPEAIDAAPSSLGRSAAEDGGGRLSWPARNAASPQGKKVDRRRCG
jgi:hypothetical protein